MAITYSKLRVLTADGKIIDVPVTDDARCTNWMGRIFCSIRRAGIPNAVKWEIDAPTGGTGKYQQGHTSSLVAVRDASEKAGLANVDSYLFDA